MLILLTWENIPVSLTCDKNEKKSTSVVESVLIRAFSEMWSSGMPHCTKTIASKDIW